MASSLEELEDEHIFKLTLLDSLDEESETYEEDKAKLEAEIKAIERQIDSFPEDGAAVPPLSSSSFADAEDGGSSSRKRGLDALISGDQSEGKRSRRQSPNTVAHGRTAPTSSNPQNRDNELAALRRQSALERQRIGELEAARRMAQFQRDMQMAQALGSGFQTGVPNASSSIPRPSSGQAVLNRDMSFRNPKNTMEFLPSGPYNHPASSRIQSISNNENKSNVFGPVPGSQGTYARGHNNNDLQTVDLAGPSTSTGARRLPWTDEQNLRSSSNSRVQPLIKSESSNPQSVWLPRMSESRRSSLDSDIMEISADDFTPLQQRASTVSTQQQNGYLGRALTSGAAKAYDYGQKALQYGQNLAQSLYHSPYGAGPGFAGNGMNGLPSSNDPFTLRPVNAYPSIYGSPYGSMRAPNSVPNILQDDMYRSAFGRSENVDPAFNYLYADSGKTAEELNELLENIRPDEDIPPELREGTPESLQVTLMEHQKVGLAWLKKQEEGPNKGGVLADDMGLGKTIQAIALIVSRRSENPHRKSTLVLAPVALINQWEQEIKEKVKTGAQHALTVYKYHGAKKKSFAELKLYDVVITTFGSLAVELKKKEEWQKILKNNPQALPSRKEKLNLIGDDCKWYRIIVDEAQCIKNRGTQTAKAAFHLQAKYRWCMTGTPMMNNVIELFSLIHFCRIKPYSSWETFRRDIAQPLKTHSQFSQEQAMKRLQGLVRAIMLRRTKKSKLDGKPLITLPDRETGRADVEFSEDERMFYDDLEKRQQMTFNKYYKEGTVLKNYAHVLILLLRLRQACCHPHLVLDYSSTGEVDADTLLQIAKQLDQPVVERLRSKNGSFECPICMDASENPAIFFPCGHFSCLECFSRLSDPTQMLQQGIESGGTIKCPECRTAIDPKKGITDFKSFKQVHQPELMTEAEIAEQQQADGERHNDDDSDDSDEGDDSSDDPESKTESLDGFVVSDNEVKYESSRDIKRRGKRSGKGKMKLEDSDEEEVASNADDDDAEDRDAEEPDGVNAGSTKKAKANGIAARSLRQTPGRKGRNVKKAASDQETSDSETAHSKEASTSKNKSTNGRTGRGRSFFKSASTNTSGNKKSEGESKGKGKGKSGKAKIKHMSLAQLKAEAMKNKKAKARYLRRLTKFYEPSSKIERMMQLIDEIQCNAPGEKILIFSQFTSLLDLCEVPLRGTWGYTRYDGSMKPQERQDSINHFRSDNGCIAILISLKAGNAGLNLNIANHVIIMDPFWNPYVEEQAIDRAHRIGQTKPVKVHRVLVADTVEDRIVKLQESKRDLIEQALDENAGKAIGRLGTRELAYLFGVNRSL